MTLEQIAALGRKLVSFLGLFADCFGRQGGRKLLAVYVKGQLSDLHRKTAEAIGLRFGTAPRTLQRFLESIKWDEGRLRERCQHIVARQHAHPEALGVIDESLRPIVPGLLEEIATAHLQGVIDEVFHLKRTTDRQMPLEDDAIETRQGPGNNAGKLGEERA